MVTLFVICESTGVTRALIGGGGGGIFIYSCSARLISFEMKRLISKEIRRAEHDYMNIPLPQINAVVTPLIIDHICDFE